MKWIGMRLGGVSFGISMKAEMHLGIIAIDTNEVYEQYNDLISNVCLSGFTKVDLTPLTPLINSLHEARNRLVKARITCRVVPI